MNEKLLKNAEALHKAAVSDDKQKFYAILEETPELYGAVYGRFPLESLAVMYGSRKILASFTPRAAEKTVLPEYPEDYARFRSAAGRALRLYAGGKEVAPDEMRVITGEETDLNADGGRLEKTYELSHGKALKTDRRGAVISPKSRAVTGDRRKILNAVIAFAAVFLIAAAALTAVSATVLGDGSRLAPVRADSAEVLLNALDGSDRYVTIENDFEIALSEDPDLRFTGVLDGGGNIITVTGGFLGDPFCAATGATVRDLTVRYDGFSAYYSGGKRTVTLERDFTIAVDGTESVSLQSDLFGNGHTITVSGLADDGIFAGAVFDEINGNVSDLKLDFGNAEFDYDSTTGLFARVNNAAISEVEFTFSGTLHENNSDSDTYFGLLIGENRGNITNVYAIFDISGDSDFDGQAEANNSYLGGIAGLNYGKIINCETALGSAAVTVTLDVSGIVGENAFGGTVSGSVNRAAMTTSTAIKDWSPNAAGIALVNRGDIENCYNFGSLTADSDAVHEDSSAAAERGSTVVGGIAASNYGIISHSYNGGDLSSATVGAIPTIGGIVGHDTADSRNTIISECISDALIAFDIAKAAPSERYYSVGGIVATVSPTDGKSSTVTSCLSLNRFEGDAVECGGVIGAVSNESGVVTIGNVNSDEENLYLEDAGAESAIGLLNQIPYAFGGAASYGTITDKENFWYVEAE